MTNGYRRRGAERFGIQKSSWAYFSGFEASTREVESHLALLPAFRSHSVTFGTAGKCAKVTLLAHGSDPDNYLVSLSHICLCAHRDHQ